MQKETKKRSNFCSKQVDNSMQVKHKYQYDFFLDNFELNVPMTFKRLVLIIETN